MEMKLDVVVMQSGECC